MNLIEESWIPIRRRSGVNELIAPWQLTERHDNDPVIAISSPRADFDGALVQFLIGLLQTALPPRDFDEWMNYYEVPPTPEKLWQAMEVHAATFELFGDGPRFMQDMADLTDSDPKEIAALLIEAPGGNTLKNNLDHFIKRGGVEVLCPACAATALYCLQTNAPSGGVGHRTSLRGGGPLTTLVIADPRAEDEGLPATLWRDCWLNVLEDDTFARQSGNTARTAPADIFPWLASTRTSENKTGRATTPEDAHPLQMFWGMPRRIRLLVSDESGSCDLCGCDSLQLCRSYLTKNYGVNYEGGWRHPLSPHNVDKNGLPLPMHPQPGGLPYRHWLGLVQVADSRQFRREPAEVVQTFWTQRSKDVPGQFRVWAFGYDMDNMKARCWYESTIPLYQVEPALRDSFEDNLTKLVFAAGEVGNNLRNALRKAWFRRPQDKKGDTAYVIDTFWQTTEAAFYTTLGRLRAVLADADVARAVRESWLNYLCRQAEALFDRWAVSGPIEDADPRRIAVARHELNAYNRSATILGGLGLPTPNQKKQKKAATSAA